MLTQRKDPTVFAFYEIIQANCTVPKFRPDPLTRVTHRRKRLQQEKLELFPLFCQFSYEPPLHDQSCERPLHDQCFCPKPDTPIILGVDKSEEDAKEKDRNDDGNRADAEDGRAHSCGRKQKNHLGKAKQEEAERKEISGSDNPADDDDGGMHSFKHDCKQNRSNEAFDELEEEEEDHDAAGDQADKGDGRTHSFDHGRKRNRTLSDRKVYLFNRTAGVAMVLSCSSSWTFKSICRL